MAFAPGDDYLALPKLSRRVETGEADLLRLPCDSRSRAQVARHFAPAKSLIVEELLSHRCVKRAGDCCAECGRDGPRKISEKFRFSGLRFVCLVLRRAGDPFVRLNPALRSLMF